MSFLRIFTFSFLLAAFAGCGEDSNRKPTAPSTVTVKYKNKPVPGAIVTFIITDNPSMGITDADGKCSLKTYVENDGAVIGMNAVTIVKTEADEKTKQPVKPEDADLIGVLPPPILKNLIPQKYSNPKTSGLSVEVKTGTNDFNFDLVD